jgi:SAM-dependent methyltransferase
VGCGSGLVLQALAPLVKRYVGMDPSAEALERNQAWAAAQGIELELVEGFAHELTTKIQGPFDLVIAAGVLQFFPGPRYLEVVLGQLASLVVPGGAVLLADVIDPSSGQFEGGLRIPPAYFDDLAARPGLFAGVEVCHRDAGAFANELGARYDVVLRVGNPVEGSVAVGSKRWWTAWHVNQQPQEPPSPTGMVPSLDAIRVHSALPPLGEGSEVMIPAVPEVNRRVEELFTEVLQRGVGPDDDFFDAGGHSLVAADLIARLRKEFRTDFTLRQFFERPTIRAVATEVHRCMTGAVR